MIINNETIYKKTLPFVKEYGRKLDYYLILNLLEGNHEEKIIEELLKYQNFDGGFGNSLEPDTQVPNSSVLATDIAISILNDIGHLDNDKLIADIVRFYISKYDTVSGTFEFIPKEVDNYPRAIWWNNDINDNPDKFNPTPEVLGFLFKHRQFVEEFPIIDLVDNLCRTIKDQPSLFASDHSLYSVIRFYNYIDSGRKKIIKDSVNSVISKIMILDKDEWIKYVPQPIDFIKSKEDALYEENKRHLEENLEFHIEHVSEDGVWYPSWKWYRYPDVFSKITKFQWMGYITYKKLKALKQFGLI